MNGIGKAIISILAVIFSLVCAVACWAFGVWLLVGVILPMFNIIFTLTFWQYVAIGALIFGFKVVRDLVKKLLDVIKIGVAPKK